MKLTKRTSLMTAYWTLTALLLLFLASAVFLDLSHSPQIVAVTSSLGYPGYFLDIDGIAKLLALLAIVLPGFHRLREWAYAGLVFLTVGAGWSLLATHQNPFAPLSVLILVAASYLLNRARAMPPHPLSA